MIFRAVRAIATADVYRETVVNFVQNSYIATISDFPGCDAYTANASRLENAKGVRQLYGDSQRGQAGSSSAPIGQDRKIYARHGARRLQPLLCRSGYQPGVI